MTKFIKRMYQHSPIFLQNLSFSIHGLSFFRERHLSPYYKNYLNFLLKSQWYSKKELEDLQNKNLRAIIKHAYETAPYYHKTFRSLNLRPDDIKTKQDLKKLPIIDKEEVRNNWDDFISNKYHWWQKIKTSTGGSTGSNLPLIWDKKSVLKEHCYADRQRNWMEVKLNSKIAHFGSAAVLFNEDQKKPPFWRSCAPGKMLYFSPFHLSEKYLPYYVEKLRKFNPQIIRGHPSKIYLVARYMRDQGLNGIKPKAVFTSSEVLQTIHKNTIEDAFDCKVFDYYGNNEHVSSIGQCEKGRYHINSEYGVIEFIKDGEYGASGETCDMVCTGFINYAMPLIRYRIEDLAVPTDEKCGCKRKLPLVKVIQGRKADIIITKDGRYLAVESIVDGIDSLYSIIEWQVIQKSKEHYIINCTVDQNRPFEDEILNLKEIISRRIGEGEIELNIVDSIKKRPGDKFRTVISEVKT